MRRIFCFMTYNNNNYFLYMRWWFLQFLFVNLRKNKNSKSKLAPRKLLSKFENLASNPVQRPHSGDFDTENAYRKALVIL
jgi:hypothetical protein